MEKIKTKEYVIKKQHDNPELLNIAFRRQGKTVSVKLVDYDYSPNHRE